MRPTITFFYRTFLVVLVILFPGEGYSQIGDPGGDPGVPITGIEWLVVAGGLFGARRIYKRLRSQ